MRKFRLTRQYFESSSPPGSLFPKKKGFQKFYSRVCEPNFISGILDPIFYQAKPVPTTSYIMQEIPIIIILCFLIQNHHHFTEEDRLSACYTHKMAYLHTTSCQSSYYHGVWYDQEFSNCTVDDSIISVIIRRWRQPGGRKTFSAF